MKVIQNRQLKLQPKYRQLVFGQKIVPELKLSGLWLEQQGFYAGQLVEVEVRHGELVIRPAVR